MLVPARMSETVAANSSGRAPVEDRATRSIAAIGLSPAATARASRSATVGGNSRAMRDARLSISRLSR